MRSVCLVIFAALLSTACKGDKEKCEQAARNYAELMFWKKANVEIEALPAGERDLARKKKLSIYANKVEESIDFITEQCVSANNDEQVECMIAAKTAEAIAKCADPAGSD